MANPTNRGKAAAAARPASLAAYRARAKAEAEAQTESGSVNDAPPPSARALELSFAAAARSDAQAADFHHIVAGVLARADRVTEPHTWEWDRFLHLLERHRTNPRAALNCGVLANLVGLAVFGAPADFTALTELGRRLGPERLAAVQHRTARFIEPAPTFPITTAALRRMAVGEYVDPAVALLLEGVEPDRFLPVIRTRAELVGVVDAGTVLEWRHHLAMIAASPWSPYSQRLVELATKAHRQPAATIVERFTEVCQGQHKEREREQVADEVRRLVYASGVTQGQFARWVGTSPSRLSTYVSGSVTPSASLMLRMARTSRLLQERDVSLAPSTESEQSWGAARTTADVGGPERAATGPGEHPPVVVARHRSHLSAI